MKLRTFLIQLIDWLPWGILSVVTSPLSYFQLIFVLTRAVANSRGDRIIICAGNQAELFQLAKRLRDSGTIILLRPPSFRLLSKLSGRSTIRSAYRLPASVITIEYGFLMWLVERLAAHGSQYVHSFVLMAALRTQSVFLMLATRTLSPKTVIANFFMGSPSVYAYCDKMIINYPYVSPRFRITPSKATPNKGAEKEGFLVPDCEFSRLEDELSLASQIVVGSNFARRTLEADFSDDRPITVLPYGIDTSIFHADGADERQYDILFVGPNTYRKGADLLVSLAEHYASQEHFCRIEIVGRGWHEPWVSNLNNVTYHGLKSQPELADIMRRSRIVLMPTRAEGMGLVGLEAMACGCVVIASPNGPDTYIENGINGFLVNTFQLHDWTACIDSIDAACQKAVSAAAITKGRQSDWDLYALEWSNLLTARDVSKCE